MLRPPGGQDRVLNPRSPQLLGNKPYMCEPTELPSQVVSGAPGGVDLWLGLLPVVGAPGPGTLQVPADLGLPKQPCLGFPDAAPAGPGLRAFPGSVTTLLQASRGDFQEEWRQAADSECVPSTRATLASCVSSRI